MAKNIKKLFALILAVAMVMSLSVNAFAASGVRATTEAGDVFLNKEAEWSNEKYVADVTLSVGGESEDLSSDIVMIIGRGPSSDYEYVIETIKKMLIATDGTETEIKLGLVTFADTTEKETVLPLTPMKETDPDNLAEDDMDYIIAEACQKTYTNYSGVNLESALITARDMLIADDDVPAERKHMIVVSTGLTYWFDDADGSPAFIVRANSTAKKPSPQHADYSRWLEHRHPGTDTKTYGYLIPSAYLNNADSTTDAWYAYWNDVVSWIEKDQDNYVYSVRDTFSDFTSRLKSRIIVDADDLARVKKDADGNYMLLPYATGKDDVISEIEQHALAYERAQYEAWVVYNEMQTPIGESFETVLGDEIEGLGFNCYAIANGAPSDDGEDRWLESNQIGYNFMRMLGGENTVNWRDHADFFAPIENKIMYSITSGSYVEDYMGFSDEEEYDFDFIDELDKITLKVGQTEYITTKLDTPTEGFDSSYAFTAPEADEPTFWLDYVKGNGTSDEMFRWSYGENVSKFAPVVLDYQVRLVKIPDVLTEDLLYATNKEATLYDPDDEVIEEFPIPELEIHTVTYQYVGDIQPENAPELPATDYYTEGTTVIVADEPSAEGYVFSGWSETGSFEMPNKDVVITGSWEVASAEFVPEFAYEVRYFLEQLDGSYVEATEDFYRAFDELGATVFPAEKSYDNYVLNTELSDAQGTVIAPSVIDGELNILRMNVYFDYEAEFTVTYQYVGDVQPENAPELPAGGTYKVGEIVTVADDATAEGYVFSGWSETGSFEMPAEDVVITGSWKVAATPMVPTFAYEVRYFLEELDGSYVEATEDFYRAFDELGATVSPAEKAYTGFVLNAELSDAQGTVIAPSVVNGELNILRMNVYFDREAYTVTYKYTGAVQPEDPSELPATETYKYGETVTVADDATAEGYVFSGWSEIGTFEMPAEDVVITGSWKVATSQFVPTFAYEVRYFLEQRDGSYEEVTADFYRAFDELGATVSPAEKAYDNYVLNAELSDAQGTVIAPSVVDGELNILRMNVYFDLMRYTVTYIDRGAEIQITEDLLTGDEIPDCKDPNTYYDDDYKYFFKNWKLIEGEEGTDGTVGVTDLVYESVYLRKDPIKPAKPEIEIPDEDIPLAEIPALFGDDHYAYIIGYTDGLVHPEANITRAEVATIFFRLLAEDIRNTMMTDVNDFSDVEKGQWYNHAVSTLSSMGIVYGRNDGSFDPNEFITRAEFAAIAARFDPTGNPEGVFFSDIAGHWAEREIVIAANNGWVEGYNGLFRPDDYITRAEAMTLVNRVLHRLPETEHDLLEYMVIWPDNMDVDAWYYLAVQEATNSHDYVRKTNPIYESWTQFIEPYDWSLLEY